MGVQRAQRFRPRLKAGPAPILIGIAALPLLWLLERLGA